MITLHIKGTKKAAQRAASRRGIGVKHCKLRGGKGEFGENTVICEAPCSQMKKIVEWYGEKTGEGRRGRGFAPGTLVFSTWNCGTPKGGLSGGKRRRR
jgi:hypothetical protein